MAHKPFLHSLREFISGLLNGLLNVSPVKSEHIEAYEFRGAITRATTCSVISTDTRGSIKTFNSAAEKMLGYSATEVLGKSTLAIIHDPHEMQCRAQVLTRELGRKVDSGLEVFVSKLKDTAHADENEWTYIRKDGARFKVNLCVTAIRCATGEITGYVYVAVNLSEQNRLQRVMASAAAGVFELDYPITTVVFMDDQCKRILGLAPNDELSLEKMRDLAFDEDRLTASAILQDHLMRNTDHFELEFRLKNTVRWVRVRGKITRNKIGTGVCTAAVFDLTQEKTIRDTSTHPFKRKSAA
jgi:PAS domain S-box-containing protein